MITQSIVRKIAANRHRSDEIGCSVRLYGRTTTYIITDVKPDVLEVVNITGGPHFRWVPITEVAERY